MRRFASLSIVVLLFGFSLSAQPTYESPVEFLSDTREKSYFLLSVYEINKAVNNYEDSVMLASGFRSEEHLLAIDSLVLIDSLLTDKVNDYLSLYGYPKKEDFSETPRLAPLTVMNQARDRDKRLKYFSKFYKAYRDEDIEERRFITFLEREYKYTFQKNFQSYARGEERVEELIKKMDLMPLQTYQLRFPE